MIFAIAHTLRGKLWPGDLVSFVMALPLAPEYDPNDKREWARRKEEMLRQQQAREREERERRALGQQQQAPSRTSSSSSQTASSTASAASLPAPQSNVRPRSRL